MKRWISLILSIMLFVMSLPLMDTEAAAENRNHISRYSVLVLDVSGTARFENNGRTIYTADSSINYVKKSANSFLSDLINAEGNNYVAIVAFAKKASVVLDFTDNISEVIKSVNTLTSHDNVRDINAGLSAANGLFQKVDSSAVKNTILVTTGMTNEGKYTYDGHYDEETVGSNWRRMDTQIRLYAYANAAYEMAAVLKNSSTLYVLGLFQTMDHMPEEGREIAEFFRLTAFDLATSENTFYDVENPDDIEFVFGEIANNITASNGYFKYAGKINQDSDSAAEYWYSDSYFSQSATKYNASLATMSLCLELSTWSSFEKENWYHPSYTPKDAAFWQDKLCNVKTLLLGNPNAEDGYGGIGFSDFKANDFWQDAPTKDSIGVCAARKSISTSLGDKYTLIALVVRGGGYGAEWASNFTIGKSGEHDGFAAARNNVLDFLDTYISSLNLSDNEKNIKIWVTGYSRAGATANMVAGALDTYHSLPDGAVTSIDDIYCYTFEAPQGAVRSSLRENYSNIFNVLNLNDLVPLVAPYSWDFARYNYQNDITLPSRYDTRKFVQQKAAMLEEMKKLGYPNFKYKISEESTMKNFKVDKSKFLPGGDPLWWFEESTVDTNTVLQKGVSFLAEDVIPSREYYYENLEYCARQLLGILMDYYGAKNGLNNYANEVVSQAFMIKLDELFTFDNITYIVSPMFSMNPFKSYDDRVDEVKIRLGKKIGGIFAEYAQIEGFIDSVVDILTDTIVQIARDVWDNNTDSINTVCKVVDLIVSSEMQGHYPEICLAWCRSLDPNYNTAAAEDSSNITRIIRINCPVNINVYDSDENRVASMMNDVTDESIDGIISYVNDKGEKLFFLPGDEDYRLDIVASDEGLVNYSVSEYNFIYAQTTCLQNYYDIPIKKNDELTAIVPAISRDELIQNDINGSTADYQILNDGEVLTYDEKYSGKSIEQEYYDISLSVEGNGGYVEGAGRFIKGSFAKIEAYSLPNAEFLGWYVNGELVSEESSYRFVVTENTTISAKFSDTIYSNLSFDTDGGGTIHAAAGIYADGTKIGIEAIPANGYEFIEWTSADGGVFEDSKSASTEFTISDRETVVTAHFKPLADEETTKQTYMISYTLNNGYVSNNPTSYTADHLPMTLMNPTRSGYTFIGWTGSNGNIPQTSVTISKGTTGNLSYTANWKQNDEATYTISYMLNGGDVLGNPTSYTMDLLPIVLKNPTRNGYTFTGWTGSSGSIPQKTVIIQKGTTGNLSYTANWEKNGGFEEEIPNIIYRITYTLNGGSVSGNPAGYTEDGLPITLKNPIRDGYTFIGWTGSNGSTPQMIVMIERGSTGNKSYTANWSKNQSVKTSMKGAKISLKKTSRVYNGKKKQPSVTVKVGSKTLKKGTDYKVTYKNNQKVGTASVIISGTGSYTGRVTKKFKIVPKGISVSKISAESKGFTVSWKKQAKSVDGCQLQYSTSRKFTKKTTVKKTVTKPSKTKLDVKKCRAKKKYYIRIRTFKTVKGKKYYSDWSKVKVITTKK